MSSLGDTDSHLCFFGESDRAYFILREKKADRAGKLQDLLYQQIVDGSAFCDVTLNIQETMMKAHWCVLVSCPYFQALYNFNSVRKKAAADEIVLDYGDADAMQAAIKFLYTGEVKLTLENVQDFLAVADFLQLTDLTSLCAQLIGSLVLNLENCVTIMLMCSMYNLDEYNEAFKYVCGHLPALMEGDQLLDITKASIFHFLKDPTLSYVKQEDFFNFIVRWTERDKESRKKDFQELFLALNLILVNSDFLNHTIQDHPLVENSQPCKNHCMEAQRHKGFAPDGQAMTDVIFVGGGAKYSTFKYEFYSAHLASSHLLAYFPTENRWTKLPDLPCGIKYPLMTVTDEGKLLVLDAMQSRGRSHKKFGEILRYCPRENSWDSYEVTFPPGHFELEFHLLTQWNERLFVVASCRTHTTPQRYQPHRYSKQSPKDSNPLIIRHYVQLLELNWTTNKLHVMFTFFQRSLGSEIQAKCSQLRASTRLDGDMIYVTGTKCFNYKAVTCKHGEKKFLFYDLRKGYGKEVLNRNNNFLSFDTLAVGLEEGFISTRFGKVNRKMFQLKEKKVINTPHYTIPVARVAPTRVDFSYTSVDDELFVFGGRENDVMKHTQSAAKYSFSTKIWLELEPLPLPMEGAGVARGRVPVDVLRCHSDCPHCYYTDRRDNGVCEEFYLDEGSPDDMVTTYNYSSYNYYDTDSMSGDRDLSLDLMDEGDFDDWML